MPRPRFNPITPGVPVCGTLWADGGNRDTDWYEVVTTETVALTWTVEAAFDSVPLVAGFIPTDPLGVPDCSTVSVIAPVASGRACEPVSVTTICLPPGTYWFFVGPAGFEGLPCGADNAYVATLTADPCALLGACCYNDGYECANNLESECDALGGEWARYESCENYACLTPCPDAAVDIEIFTDYMPADTHWEVTDAITGEIYGTGGPFSEYLQLYRDRVCVPVDRCVTFTIYDDWGNGICCYRGDGYYNVYYQGSLVRTGGRFGLEESTDMGPNCPGRLGACCVAGECVGDLREATCTALSGVWTEGALCSEGYDCTGEVDYRLTAPVVNATGNVCNADNDCSYFGGDDREYLITLPEDGTWAFSLCGSKQFWDSVISVGLTRCGREIGFEDDYCLEHPQLVATIPAGDYYVTVESVASSECGPYLLNVLKFDECDGECPPGATPENEPDCYDDYVDVTNGGCDVYPPVFMPITNGETVCGTSGTYIFNGEPARDTDWYEFAVFGPANLKWDVCATFDVEVTIRSSFMGGCDDAYPVASAFGPANTSIATGIPVTTGVYWMSVAPRNTTGVPCGSSYVARFTVEYLEEYGACCHGTGCITLGTEYECVMAWGGEWYPGERCVEDGGDFACPVTGGACCTSDGFCIMLEDEIECYEFYAGTWYPGELCADYGGDFICPGSGGGACCTPDNFCVTLESEFECSEFYGGTWYPGEVCVEDGGNLVCPGSGGGACCTPDNFCVTLESEFECIEFYAGAWYPGEACVEDGGDFVCPTEPGWCDLDGDGDVDRGDYLIFFDAFGGPVDGNPPEDYICDHDGSGKVGMADYAAWLDCYRVFIGDPLAGPPGKQPDIEYHPSMSVESVRPESERLPRP